MADYSKITKEEFDNASNLYPPNRWVLFGFKYFSKGTEAKDMFLKRIVLYSLLTLFAVSFFGTVFEVPRKLILIPTIIYTIVIFLLVGYMFTITFLNNKRVMKIAEKLEITVDQYNALVKKFYGDE